MGLVLVKHLLPAISSLVFIAPIAAAVRKNLYTLAFIYGFMMFFQLFYHLCKVPVLSIIFCAMGEDMLTYFSTYGLVLSIYHTLIRMTDFESERKHNLCLTGGLLAGIRIFQTNTGYGVYSPTLIVGFIFLVWSWAPQIWKSKRLYPEKEKWIKILLPGLLLGALSFVFLLVIENSWNYGFVHSTHHVFLAASLFILLRYLDDGPRLDTSKCDGCALCCCI